jgi:hypothetical protein
MVSEMTGVTIGCDPDTRTFLHAPSNISLVGLDLNVEAELQYFPCGAQLHGVWKEIEHNRPHLWKTAHPPPLLYH